MGVGRALLCVLRSESRAQARAEIDSNPLSFLSSSIYTALALKLTMES